MRVTTLVFTAAALLASAAPARAQEQEQALRGWLHVVWDGERTVNNPDGVEFFVVDARGVGSRLLVQEPGGEPRLRLALLEGHFVEVRGERVQEPLPAQSPAVRLRALRDVAQPAPMRAANAIAAVVQPAPFVTLMCRFADEPPPFTAAVVHAMVGQTYPGMGHFYAELSGSPSIMAGNAVAGWFALPQPRAAYVQGTSTDFSGLVRDCVGAADPSVDFSGFTGINLQFSGALSIRSTPPYDTLSFGGGWTVTVDGQTRSVGMTWLSRQHVGNYVVYSHEMGHALGWPHSSGDYGQEYDSNWDMMSRGYLHFTQQYGWLTIHTIAPHKDKVGWIPESRRWLPPPGSQQTALLERSALPTSTGYLIARTPLPDGSFYTAEVRRVAGYDTPLPGEAVVLHRVVNGRAYVVDPDLNGNPNDEGAMWRVGETFTDAAHGISLRVDGQSASGFTVTITGGAPPLSITSDSLRPGGTMGSAYADTLRATGVSGSGAWSVSAGTLPSGLALDAATGVISGVPAQAGAFTLTATFAAAGRQAQKRLTTHVVKPQLQPAAVVDQLLGTGALTPDQARFLDLLGNRNGRVDVGDVRAWLMDNSQLSASQAAELNEILNAIGGGDPRHEGTAPASPEKP